MEAQQGQWCLVAAAGTRVQASPWVAPPPHLTNEGTRLSCQTLNRSPQSFHCTQHITDGGSARVPRQHFQKTADRGPQLTRVQDPSQGRGDYGTGRRSALWRTCRTGSGEAERGHRGACRDGGGHRNRGESLQEALTAAIKTLPVRTKAVKVIARAEEQESPLSGAAPGQIAPFSTAARGPESKSPCSVRICCNMDSAGSLPPPRKQETADVTAPAQLSGTAGQRSHLW